MFMTPLRPQLTENTTKYNLPAFAECPVREDGDECEKGIRRRSRLPKNLPAYTNRFGEGRLASRSAKVDMLRRVSPKL
jgi:hypothetical protein